MISGSRLPTAVLVGSAFAAGASTAPAVAETAPPAHVRHISELQQLRNNQARDQVVNLARLIMTGPAARKGGQQNYTDGTTGEQFGVAGVMVGADTLSGTTPGQYSFTVAAPINKNNQLKLNQAESVTVTEGTTKESWVTSTFSVIKKDHNQVNFHAFYNDPGNVYHFPEAPYELGAYTDPDSNKEARLTPTRLIRAIHKSISIVQAADKKYPTGLAGRMEPPFKQPADTLVGMK